MLQVTMSHTWKTRSELYHRFSHIFIPFLSNQDRYGGINIYRNVLPGTDTKGHLINYFNVRCTAFFLWNSINMKYKMTLWIFPFVSILLSNILERLQEIKTSITNKKKSDSTIEKPSIEYWRMLQHYWPRVV